MKKPVLFRITNNLGLGGVQRRLYTLLPRLTRFYQVHVVTYRDKGLFFDQLRQKGISCHFVPLKNKWDLAGISNLSKLLKKYKADIVHTHSLGGNIPGILAAVLAKVPVRVAQVHVSTLHWYAKGYWHKKKQALEENLIHLFFTHKILFVSQETKEYFLDKTFGLKKKCVVLHNGIEFPMETNGQSPLELKPYQNKKIIGFVGRLAQGKGVNFFLSFAQSVLQCSNQYVFVLIGPGELKFWAQKIPPQFKESILILGPKEDVFRYYKAMDLLFFGSQPGIEGMPGVVLEAASVGLPILARKTKPLQEIKQFYSRIAFIQESKTPLENLEHALNLPFDSGQKFKEHFSIEAMVERTVKLYQSLCA